MPRHSTPALLRLARHAIGLCDAAQEIGDPELTARVEALAEHIRRGLSEGLACADDAVAGGRRAKPSRDTKRDPG